MTKCNHFILFFLSIFWSFTNVTRRFHSTPPEVPISRTLNYLLILITSSSAPAFHLFVAESYLTHVLFFLVLTTDGFVFFRLRNKTDLIKRWYPSVSIMIAIPKWVTYLVGINYRASWNIFFSYILMFDLYISLFKSKGWPIWAIPSRISENSQH